MWLGSVVFLVLFWVSVQEEIKQAGASFGSIAKRSVAETLCDSLYNSFIPSFSFVQEMRGDSVRLADRQIAAIMPLYGYTLEQKKELLAEDDVFSLDDILLAEAMEGHGGVWEESTEGTLGVGGAPDSEGSAGNGGAHGSEGAAGTGEGIGNDGTFGGSEVALEELFLEENAAAVLAGDAGASVFVPGELQAQVNLEEMKAYETLVSNFYTIDANTMAGSNQLDITKLLGADMSLKKETDGPQILIYHTHSQEAFADSVPGDPATSIVGVGERLAELLAGQYGYEVLHHKGQYDVESRDDAYSQSLPEIEKILAENPSVQVVLDLHRDQMPEEKKLVMDLQGRPTARFMFFNGLSYTRRTGEISYLYNENLQDNLAFSFQMQLKAAEYYPGLTRKIYLKGYRYNMHLKPRTLLVELGAQNNTVEEVMNACDPLAHILDLVLSGQ